VTRLRLLVAAVVIGALALTATVDASASTTTSAHRGATATVQAKKKKKSKKKKAATVKLAAITAGTVLVTPDGRTLYMLDKDNGGTTSACTGPCATIWPALVATGTPKAGSGLDSSKLTVAMQADGRNQVVYNGHLLYNFSGDTAPGDAKGLGLPGWHAVSPEGAPVGGA
jgi:predicted lipoprotein with Yx(FWY)xxD motif